METLLRWLLVFLWYKLVVGFNIVDMFHSYALSIPTTNFEINFRKKKTLFSLHSVQMYRVYNNVFKYGLILLSLELSVLKGRNFTKWVNKEVGRVDICRSDAAFSIYKWQLTEC